MTLKLDTPNHELDSEGYLVPLEEETPEAYLLRTATALWEAGMSPNTPEQVMKQFEEPLPPDPGLKEGETQEEYDAQQAAWKEEWEQRRQARIEAYNQEVLAEREAKKAAKAQSEAQPEHEEAVEEEHPTRRGRRSRE